MSRYFLILEYKYRQVQSCIMHGLNESSFCQNVTWCHDAHARFPLACIHNGLYSETITNAISSKFATRKNVQ